MNNRLRLWGNGWHIPILVSLIIASGSLGLFSLTHLFDVASRFRAGGRFFPLLYYGDSVTALYSVTAVAQSLAATLGIVITAVFIVVQLNANRYTPKILDLFVRDLPNLSLLTFFIISIVFSIWVVNTVKTNYTPHLGILLSVILLTACFLTLIPYLIYILNFLKPTEILKKIAREADTAIRRVNDPRADLAGLQRDVASTIEQISDMATSSIQMSDVEVAMGSIVQLKEIVLTYLEIKSHENTRWFDCPSPLLLGFSHASLRDFREKKTWLEAKVLSQYSLIAEMALTKIKDAVSALAVCTREIGTSAVKAGDMALLTLTIRHFNTFLRAAVNKGDKAALYHLLYQYRLMAQGVMDVYPELLTEIASHFSYYGILAEDAGLGYILETAAHDINTLNQYACEKKLVNAGDILKIFLDLGRALSDGKRQRAMTGLLKSYAILGCFYLWKGDERPARRVAEAFTGVPGDLLRRIEDQLSSVASPDFWEVTDRGVNFDFMPEEQRKLLPDFFRLIPGGEKEMKP